MSTERRFLIGTSWKMNKTEGEARAFFEELFAAINLEGSAAELFIIPPFTALHIARAALTGHRCVRLGAQNMHWATNGEYTGEISAAMLVEAGVDIVELGHSERRIHFGETDGMVAAKVRAAIGAGLDPLICVGDTQAERSAGAACESVLRQVKLAIAGLEEAALARCIFAYEPVWAIGEGGEPARADVVATVHAAIRSVLDANSAVNTPVLYGGSVTEKVAADLLDLPEVDGLFVGRAAWSAAGFASIVRLAFQSRRKTREKAPS